jgi:miniconductance mechanosensitive channel
MNLSDSVALTDTAALTSQLELLPGSPPWVQTLVGLGLLVLASVAANFIVKHVILRLVARIVPGDWPAPSAIAARLANIVPALIISAGIVLVPNLPEWVVSVTRNVVGAFVILTIALAIGSGLTFANQIYSRRPDAASRPIKGYIQVAKIVLFMAAAILMIAVLMEESPLLLLSGLGAMAAVLMLVFRDTILSLVASVQLTSNDMLRVGDWIEMPALNADGDVIDIALHTVKVQNWDKTITTIPTHRLISDSYKNYRGMKESGGRRIVRSIPIDQNTVRFLKPEEVQDLRRFALIDEYLERKRAELEKSNRKLVEAGRDPVNERRVTNLGTFRAYVLAYLRANTRIAQGMTLIVRQLEATPQGLPLQIYCFTNTTAWAEYEDIQGDIFDHLLAVVPLFRLRLFQQPSGLDLAQLAGPGEAASAAAPSGQDSALATP